jgi:hypothetical protein
MAGIWDTLFGSQGKTEKLPTMNPQQLEQLQQIMQMLSPEGKLGQGQAMSLDRLMEMLDPSSEAQQRFADPYMQQFEQQTVPGLAERFAGAGATGGALSSSGFGQALGGAGAGLQSQLAGLKSQLQQSAMKDLMGQYQNLSQTAMGAQPFAYQQQPGQQGLVQGALQGWAGGGFGGANKMASGLGNMWSNYGPVMGNV